MRSIILALLTCVALPLLAADTRTVAFGGVEVDFTLEDPPQPSWRSNAAGGSTSKSKQVNQQWGVVTVEFYPGVGDAAGKKENSWRKGEISSLRSGWIDDVSLQVRVIFPTDASGGRDKTVYGMFVGRTSFWSIPLDAQRHVAIMLVPSQLIERYITLRAGGRTERQASRSDFVVEALFLNRAGKIIGAGYYGVRASRGQNDEAAFNELAASVPAAYTIDGAVLSRDKTPWFLYNFEQYDLIKTDVTESMPHGKR